MGIGMQAIPMRQGIDRDSVGGRDPV